MVDSSANIVHAAPCIPFWRECLIHGTCGAIRVGPIDVDIDASNRRTARAMGVTDHLGLMPDPVADVHATGGNRGRASLDDLFEALGNREPENTLRLFDGANDTLRRARRAPIADDHLPAMIPLLEARGAGHSSESIQGSLLMSRARDRGQFDVRSSQQEDCGRFEVLIWGAEQDIAETTADIARAEAAIQDKREELRRVEADIALVQTKLAAAYGSAPLSILKGLARTAVSAVEVGTLEAERVALKNRKGAIENEIRNDLAWLSNDLRPRQASAKRRLEKARKDLSRCRRAGGG